jgi:hypothetical protein
MFTVMSLPCMYMLVACFFQENPDDRKFVQAKSKWAFGVEGRDGCPPDSDVDLTLKLLQVKAVKMIDPDHKGSIVKTILKDGAAYHSPNDFAAVTVSWTGFLHDGTQFDQVPRHFSLCCLNACVHEMHLKGCARRWAFWMVNFFSFPLAACMWTCRRKPMSTRLVSIATAGRNHELRW